MKHTFSILLIAAGLASASPLSINLSNPNQNSVAGAQVIFNGSLFNNSGATLSIGSDSFTLDSPLTLNDTSFFVLAPLTLASATDSGSFQFFTINIPLLAGFNVYQGSFSVLDNDETLIGTATFSVTLAPVTNNVPEPSTLVIAAPLLFFVNRWRQQRISLKSSSPGTTIGKEQLNS